MDQSINLNNTLSYRYIFTGLFFSSLLLATCSFLQKIIAGYNPFLPQGYIIPIIFGSIAGGLLGVYLYKIKILSKALELRVGGLESMLPICSHCKKIRKPDADPNDRESWVRLESYIHQKTNSSFSHGLCPDCYEERKKEIQKWGVNAPG